MRTMRNVLVRAAGIVLLLSGMACDRTKAPAQASPPQSSSRISVTVLCQECMIPSDVGGVTGAKYIVVLDQESGDVWAYAHQSEGYVRTDFYSRPIKLGKLPKLGAAVLRADPSTAGE